jgi:hypothetical protein
MARKVNVVEVPMSAWTILPPPASACQVCAREHEPEQPHDAPTWDDALAHVSDKLHGFWREELAKHGIVVAPRESAP